MKKNKRNKEGGVVYSTNPDFDHSFAEALGQKSRPEKENLKVHLTRLKGNKEVTEVRGFTMPDSDVKELAKQLKSACGVGGSSKNGIILLQGNHRDRVMTLLSDLGYKAKKSGG
ncbi:MAG: translation initiation factor [Cyclobacteriaceae bacterium]